MTFIPKNPEFDTSTEHEVRIEKVQKLRSQGIEPWPNNKPINATCASIIKDGTEPATLGKEYTLSGRLMTKRVHGKSLFGHIQDRTGKIQIYLKADQLGVSFEFFNHMVDLGDIIWCKGTTFITKTGELTLQISEFTLLSKCLHPLPEKFHGIADIEVKYRQRYLDLMTNEETRERFKKRSAIIKFIRAYFDAHDFLEVETPMLHPIPGGASARPFITHHNTLDSDFYLRIAPELYLKKLVIGGFERVYELNRCFRNEGISTRHNPEFTTIEWYMAYEDYHFMMDFIETLLRSLIKTICGSLEITFGEKQINFAQPFDRISAYEALLKYSKLTAQDLTKEHIDTTLKQHGLQQHVNDSYNKKIFVLFEELAEKQLIQPTFIIDYPLELSPLSKRDSEHPELAARFELFIAGMEFANGFNELNDPFDQAERFKDQAKAHAAGDSEAMHYDADFVHALEYGLPPTVGAGIGIDRLVMLLTNTTSIKEVILFPTLKKK